MPPSLGYRSDMNDAVKTFGEQLRDWRLRRRMSQLDLAGEAEISTRVTASNPVVVERSMYWDRGATSSPGLTR